MSAVPKFVYWRSEKYCPQCKQILPVDLFGKNKARHDGLSSYCRVCKIADRARRDKAQPELAQKRRREEHAKHRERDSRAATIYRITHPEVLRAAVKRYRDANLELVRSREKDYRQRNPEKIAAKANRRRALGFIDHNDIADLREKQKNRCVSCRNVLKKFHLDHIEPVVSGGTNSKENLQLLCPRCNLSKWKKDNITFMRERGYLL